jgi:protein transport protein SEC31
MGRLREITRTAAFAWAPGTGPPLIVTGTRAGAVDVDFSDDIQLELWDLALDDPDKGGELQPVGSIGVDSRYAFVQPPVMVSNCLSAPSLITWTLGFTTSPGANRVRTILGV